MSAGLAVLLLALGFGGSFLAGLVGIGGAIVMIPLLLYVPPVFGFASLGIKVVSGITIVQVVAGSLAGLAGHARSGAVDRGLVLWLGGSMVVGSATGAVASAAVPARVLEIVFACVALAAAALTLARRDRLPDEDAARTVPPRLLTVAIGGGVGTIAGMLGAGGAFLLVPLMLHVLRIPMRTVVGSSLGIVVVSSIAGLAGKALTGQVDWALAVFLVVGAVPGGLIGARVSRRTKPHRLSLILGVVIALVAVRIWLDVLFGARA
jgi:hypothetical protein